MRKRVRVEVEPELSGRVASLKKDDLTRSTSFSSTLFVPFSRCTFSSSSNLSSFRCIVHRLAFLLPPSSYDLTPIKPNRVMYTTFPPPLFVVQLNNLKRKRPESETQTPDATPTNKLLIRTCRINPSSRQHRTSNEQAKT